MKPTVMIKKLDPTAILPQYAKHGDAGMDLHALYEGQLLPGESKLVKTGIAISLPENYEAQVRPRSGLAYKHKVTVLNTPGTIDEGYRGDVGVILINHGDENFYWTKGERIAQMVIKPVQQAILVEVDELDETERGEGGFGSTGKK